MLQGEQIWQVQIRKPGRRRRRRRTQELFCQDQNPLEKLQLQLQVTDGRFLVVTILTVPAPLELFRPLWRLQSLYAEPFPDPTEHSVNDAAVSRQK
jgi:hypothetical protein